MICAIYFIGLGYGENNLRSLQLNFMVTLSQRYIHIFFNRDKTNKHTSEGLWLCMGNMITIYLFMLIRRL